MDDQQAGIGLLNDTNVSNVEWPWRLLKWFKTFLTAITPKICHIISSIFTPEWIINMCPVIFNYHIETEGLLMSHLLKNGNIMQDRDVVSTDH